MKNLLLFFLLITNISFGQNYTTAIGIKGGYPVFGTLNAKHFIGSQTAIEASVYGFSKTNYGTGAFVMLDYELNSELDPGFLVLWRWSISWLHQHTRRSSFTYRN